MFGCLAINVSQFHQVGDGIDAHCKRVWPGFHPGLNQTGLVQNGPIWKRTGPVSTRPLAISRCGDTPGFARTGPKTCTCGANRAENRRASPIRPEPGRRHSSRFFDELGFARWRPGCNPAKSGHRPCFQHHHDVTACVTPYVANVPPANEFAAGARDNMMLIDGQN